MDSQKILNSDYLDILFDGRNKKYGGYELRKNYSWRLGKAVSLLIGCALITSTYAFVSKAKPVDDVELLKGPIILTLPPPVEPINPPSPPAAPPPPPIRPTMQNTEPIIEDDGQVSDDDILPTQDELRNANIGATTQDGDSLDIGPPIVTHGSSGGTGVTPPPPTEPMRYVEQMPAPLYNINAYLAKNLNYPAEARATNIEGKVLIEFVVDEDGAISNVKVVGSRRHGGGLEQEAVRVVKGMPKWTPGKQNGVPVRVYFNLPINFELE